VQAARTTDGIFEQLEHHGVADLQIVERRAFREIRAVKEHVALVREPDATMTLSDEQLHNPTGGRRATEIGWP
jgi:hypothetical protein